MIQTYFKLGKRIVEHEKERKAQQIMVHKLFITYLMIQP